MVYFFPLHSGGVGLGTEEGGGWGLGMGASLRTFTVLVVTLMGALEGAVGREGGMTIHCPRQ